MSVKLGDAMGKFIYALIDAPKGDQIFKVRGISDTAVYAIAEGKVAAVVSDIPNPRVRPERRNLMAHRAVLHHLMETCSAVLPMRFGVVASSGPSVRGLLANNAEPIADQAERVSGRVEMGLRVTWDVGNIYEYFVSTHPILREARDRMLAAGNRAGREEKIEIGRLYNELVDEARKKYSERVTEVLRDYCEEIVENPPKKDTDVMNLACLVDRKGLPDFEKGVFAASKLFNNDYLFDYSGPWAPHNFVALDLHAPQAKKSKKDH